MADKVSTYRQLKLVAGFVDEDDRTIRIDNPKQIVTSTEVNALNELAAPVLIGDKYQAAFSRFKSAKIVEGVHTELDLTP